jgi:glycolate oxidase
MIQNEGGLIKDLINLVGADNIISNEQELRTYGLDRTGKENTPIVVVKPSSAKQFKRLNLIFRRYRIDSMTPRGLGLGINLGAYSNDVIIDLTSLNQILEIDPASLLVTTQSGVLFENIQKALEEKGFKAPIEPFLNGTIGGFVASGGYGYGSYRYGNIVNILRNTSFNLPNGRAIQTGSARVPPYASGYNLNSLASGAEGYFGIITEVTLEISPLSKAHSNFLCSFGDINALNDIFMKLIKMPTLTTASLYRNLLNERSNSQNLLLRFEGHTESIKRDKKAIENFPGISSYDEEKANLQWNARMVALTDIPKTSMIIEAIVPLKNLTNYLLFWEIVPLAPSFGTLINNSCIILYTFLPEPLLESKGSEIMGQFYARANELGAIPPTLGNIHREFVTRFYPNLRLMKDLKPIFDKNSRLKSRKLDF